MMSFLIKKSSAALLLATCMSPVDAIVVETMFIVLTVSTLTIAAIGTPIAGAILLFGYAYAYDFRHKITIFSSAWRYLLIISVFFAITEFAWYDAVSHIGAGKTALINLPLEVIFIVVLAWIFLSERLQRTQFIGACIALTGIVIVIGSDLSTNNLAQFGIGEAEAVIASIATGIQTVLVMKLMSKYNPIEVTGATLLIAGFMLNLQWFFRPIDISLSALPYLLIFSLVPLLLFLMQYISMKKIGASLTSIITSSSIIITLVVSVLLVHFTTLPMNVPNNISLAFVGGIISVIGMVLVFSRYENNRQEKISA